MFNPTGPLLDLFVNQPGHKGGAMKYTMKYVISASHELYYEICRLVSHGVNQLKNEVISHLLSWTKGS